MGYFKNVTPESVGIDSRGILRFLERMEENQIELHSFMVIRHGKCAAKGWWKPYGEHFRHPLYSFSKSLTATAIGFAEQEGKLSLDEKLVDIFPEFLPENPSKNLKKVNLHHLLTMSCGHETEIMDNSEKWISAFLHHPFLHEPGTFYKYNTAGTNMLAAVLRKKTGQNVTEFLKPRLLEPLGITSLTCALLGDGTELGGGGMKMVTEDMAKFTYFLLKQGEWEGKQLLRKEWFARACRKQIETAGDSENHVKDWAQGYGYQCWMCRYPGSFRADGAYGQFGVVFPDLDLIVILTTATEQTQEELSALQEELIPFVERENRVLPESHFADELKQYTGQLKLQPRHGTRNPFMEEQICQNVYEAAKKEEVPDSAEMMIGGSGLFDLAVTPVEQMRFSFGSDKMYWHVTEGGTEKEFVLSMCQEFAYGETDGHIYAGSAAWRSRNTLEMEIRRMDGLSGGRILVKFEEEGLNLEVEDTLISVGGLGIAPRKEISIFNQIKEV